MNGERKYLLVVYAGIFHVTQLTIIKNSEKYEKNLTYNNEFFGVLN